jgi:hypothetical protein
MIVNHETIEQALIAAIELEIIPHANELSRGEQLMYREKMRRFLNCFTNKQLSKPKFKRNNSILLANLKICLPNIRNYNEAKKLIENIFQLGADITLTDYLILECNIEETNQKMLKLN